MYTPIYNTKFDLYTKDGWLNMDAIIESGFPFIWIVGARGIGKTYGALKYYTKNNLKYMYLRRTDMQLETIMTVQNNPYKRLNEKENWNIQPYKVGKSAYEFYKSEFDEKGKAVPVENGYVGRAAAMSTFVNLRGFDASDITHMYWDEFVAEKHERPIKDEGGAVFGAYETANRNREFEDDQPPIQFMGTSNAFDLANPVFMYLGIVAEVEKAFRKEGKHVWFSKERGILVIHPLKSPISEQKANTALYKALGRDSTFSRLALDNDFAYEDIGRVRTRNIREYRPIVTVGELTLYEHKSEETYYCTTFRTGTCPKYTASETDCKRFFHAFRWLWTEYMYNTIEFENYFCEVLFKKYCNY